MSTFLLYLERMGSYASLLCHQTKEQNELYCDSESKLSPLGNLKHEKKVLNEKYSNEYLAVSII
jgi:hypothetical protein